MTDLHHSTASAEDGAMSITAHGVPGVAAATAAVVATIAPMLAHATLRSATHGQMRPSRLNVRRKRSDTAELKALVRSHGLLHNLVAFRPADGDGDMVEIVAGRRRHAVVGELIAEGALPPDYQIPYLLVTEDEAVEISLAENCGRADMHPADVFEAMSELVRRGRALEDIALAFHVDVPTVRQRLKLANLAPRLLALYRDDQADFKQMMALAISDDHAAQQAAWDSLGPRGRQPQDLRRLLTARLLDIRSDRLALYVGVAAYEKAGGVVTRDLFSDAGYIGDVALLERLAKEKMERQRAKLEREGAHWVMLLPRADQATLASFAQVRMVAANPSDSERAQAEALQGRIDDVARLAALRTAAVDGAGRADCDDCGGCGGGADGEEGVADAQGSVASDGATPRRLALAQEHQALCAQQRAAAQPAWVPLAADRALAGAVLRIDERGMLTVERDLIRPSDKAKLAPLPKAKRGAGAKAKKTHSERLCHELSSQRTLALQAELMERADLAVVYLTYTLVRKVLARHPGSTLARVSLGGPELAKEASGGAAAAALAAREEEWRRRLAGMPAGTGGLAWLLRQPQTLVLELLAFCVAGTLDATTRHDGVNPEFQALAQALQLDMGKWWQATGATYFQHVGKERLVAVVAQAAGPAAAVPLENLRKTAAVNAAERLLAGRAWLPELLRVE